MSDTATTSQPAELAPEVQPGPPGFTMTERQVSMGQDHKPRTVYDVRFGSPVRTLTVRALTLGDNYDVAEISGDNSNQFWLNLTMVAVAVEAVDGVPTEAMMRPEFRKTIYRKTLERLGEDGLAAATYALNQIRRGGAQNTDAEFKAAVKN